ncbi:MAG: hypothetical protein TYPL_0800 [Candidatus Tyloplasma litorale]|nr:MAG: hypothetical protein TYPL_0800 [Mycoplasmatales bacterium]
MAATKNTTIKTRNVPLPKDIEVDVKDKYNTSPQEQTFPHFLRNYRLFSSQFIKNVFSSKLFWILLILIPLLISFLEYVLAAAVVTDGFQKTPNLNNLDSTIESFLLKITLDLTNYFIFMPVLLMSLIIFPTFISQSRENNYLKRLRLSGSSRKQFYWFYMIFTNLFLILLIAFWFILWLQVLNIAVDSIYNSVKDSTVIESSVFPTNYWIFKSLNNTDFFVLLLIFALSMNSLGYKKSMKTKSSKILLSSGIGLWIFATIASGFTFLLSKNVIGVDHNIPTLWNGFINFIIFILKWMFLFSWPSLLLVALTIASGTFPEPGPLDTNVFEHWEELYMAVKILALIAASWLILEVFFRKKTIVSYESSR